MQFDGTPPQAVAPGSEAPGVSGDAAAGAAPPWTVVPTEPAHFRALHGVIDAVAREGRYLAFVAAPPWSESQAFFEALLRADSPSFVALRGSEVVGWCDVSRLRQGPGARLGVLGMGLLPFARHRGLGQRLLAATVAASWARGIDRIELSVREDNQRACALYERAGFELLAVRTKVSAGDGQAHRVRAMALDRPPACAPAGAWPGGSRG